MKKLFFTATVCFILTGSVFAQEIADHAIGLRLGDTNGFGAEISYQHKLKETNRLEGDLG